MSVACPRCGSPHAAPVFRREVGAARRNLEALGVLCGLAGLLTLCLGIGLVLMAVGLVLFVVGLCMPPDRSVLDGYACPACGLKWLP